MKKIEQEIWIEEEDGFIIEVILYIDGTSERNVYTEDGHKI